MNIYEKMLTIASKLNSVDKTTELDVGKGTKKAVFGEADVLKAVKPLLAEYKVYGYPFGRTIIASEPIRQGDRYINFMRVETVYRFVNCEKPEEFVDIISYGDGLDGGDKAPGKALTYSDKYAIMKAFQIVTGDDPDQETPEPTPLPIKKPMQANAQRTEYAKATSDMRGADPTATQPRPANPASQKQKDLISRMLLEREISIKEMGYDTIDSLNSFQASDLLDRLFKIPKPKKEEKKDDDDFPF